MRKKQLQEYNKKSISDIEKEINESRKRTVDLSFDLATGKVKNAKELKSVKKNIAQLLTIKREKAIRSNIEKTNQDK